MRWLLLRGLVRERRHWGDFPDRLTTRGAHVLTLDLPGVGTERGRPAPGAIGAVVDDIRARWLVERDTHALDAGPGPWRLFAPSFGGMIALAWAEAYPEDFAGIAVCNTSARDLGGLTDRFSWEAIGTLTRGLFSRGVARERTILTLVSNTEHGRARAAEFAGYSAELPIGTDVLMRQLWAASRATAPQRLDTPVYVIASEGDRLCHPRVSRALAERLGAPLALHPDAGHDLPLDDGDWVADRLTEWATAKMAVTQPEERNR